MKSTKSMHETYIVSIENKMSSPTWGVTGSGGEGVQDTVKYGTLWLGSRKKKYSSPRSTGMGCQLCPPGSCKQANFCPLTALMVAIPAVSGNQKQVVREATDCDSLLLL